MGVLQNYPNAGAVEEALDKGQAAYTEVSELKDEIDSIVAEKVSAIVAGAPEDFNTLKEMSDWIAGHEDDVTAMNSAIAANTAAIGNKLDKSALQWGEIPKDYSTIGDYILTLPVGRHLFFYKNASDTHITDMPLNANSFVEVLKYSNSTIRVNVYPVRQVVDAIYSRAYSGGAWGNWYLFTGTVVQ